MAAATEKKKPPTPPKPPSCRMPENLNDSSKERFSGGMQIDGIEKQRHLLKQKTEIPGTSELNTNVIKCSGDRPLVKPPLLPKPQTPPKPLAISPKLGSPNVKPLVPKRPQLVLPSGNNDKETRVSKMAPVAKLEEFDSFSDGPVRPPRSPKSQPFKGEPFKVFEEKPELPLKKKQLNSAGCNVEKVLTTKEKSASLGRANAFRYTEIKSKSASLGRNIHEDFAAYAEIEKGLDNKHMPIPPPRNRKKLCEHTKSVPVYAQVDYSMKKNRRHTVEKTECPHCSDEEIDDELPVIEGKLILPGTKYNVQDVKPAQRDSEVSTEMNEKEEIVCEEIKSESSDHILNGCVISEDKTSSVSALDVISVDNDACSSSPGCRTSETSVESVVKVDTENASEACKDIVVENKSELYRIISSRSDKCAASDSDLVATEECRADEPEIACSVPLKEDLNDEECPDEVFASDIKVSKESVEKISFDSLRINETVSSDQQCRLSSSSLPTRRKFDMKELGKLHRRRQSWGSYKDETPSPEKPPHFKRKPKSRSWWCDDGELSSGNLGDLDSSDNTARQSSFEEVDWNNSDNEEYSNPMRSKLSCWFGSFGKAHRKHKNRRDSNSQFYCDTGDKSTESNLEVPANSEVEADCSSRPASGLSTLSNLETLDRCDAPVSEESFEIYQHSESENEAEPCEIRDENQFESEESRLNKKSFYIAQELMTSERVFIDVLKLLNVDFKNAVHAASSDLRCAVIPEAELDKILNSLPQLQHLNEDLVRDLELRIENWSVVRKISDVIVRKGPFLKLYTSYIKNFEFQCNYLEECCQKYPRFAKVVKEFEASPRCQKLSLKHYMLKPVQRIPQYRLLLEDYLHHLPASSPDLEDTKAALKIVCDVADHANRSIKLGDHLSKLLQLQSQLGNYEIIKPGRTFLKDGELFKLSRKGMQPRYFILLNDCLLYTSYYGSVQSSGLKVNYELPLSSMKVSTPQAEDYRNEFSIISVRRSFTLCARSLQERQEWVDALQRAITDYVSRQLSFQNVKISSYAENESSSSFKLGQEAPVWIQDSRVTMCQSCTAEFTVTFRRHHCRACGKVVCGDCSDFRAPLQYMRFQSARVCEECHDTLLKEARDPLSQLNQAMKRELGNCVRITDTFKRLGPASGKKIKKYIPQRLKEVTANDTGSQMSGWLQRRSRRSWKRLWFVLKEQVLYVYKASEDVVALESLPVLGYTVETMKDRHFQLYEGIDAKLVFQLAHPGQQPHVFHADNEHLANRWIAAMNDATVLK